MKVGIIGCGKIARRAHVPSYKRLGLEIACAADKNKKRLEKVPAKKAFTNYEKLLKEDLDLVSICTPNYLHYQMCIDAAEHGKNILVEKPLSLSVEEAITIKNKIEREGVKLCIVHNWLFEEPFVRLHKMYERGEFGRLLSIHTICHGWSPEAGALGRRWQMDESKSGSILMHFIHPIYLQTWFGGRPKRVFAIGRKVCERYPLIRDIRALIKFKNCTGFYELSQFCNSPHPYVLGITGTGASATANLIPEKVRVQSPNRIHQLLEEAYLSLSDLVKYVRIYFDQSQLEFRPYKAHFELIRRYVQSIKEDSQPPVTVDDGIEAIKLAKSIEESIRENKEVRVD